MRLAMFHPAGRPMERGWVGRIDGDRIVHLAAQTLQSFFLGGGGAREHAEYPLADAVLLAPVLHPPTVRVFESEVSFVFANANAIHHPGAVVLAPPGEPVLDVLVRPVAIVGAEARIAGFSLLGEVRAPELPEPKDRDFALVLGPSVLTPDEWVPDGLDWEAARTYAAAGTTLRAGDLLAGPAIERRAAPRGEASTVTVEPLGALSARVA